MKVEFFEKVKERLSKENLAKIAAKGAATFIPIVGQIIRDIIDEFSSDKKEEILKELKELSESNFEEISKQTKISVELLKIIRDLTLAEFEVEIPKIEDVLRKDVEEEKFFRKKPFWIDFEKGCIVERKVINEIIKKLKEDRIHLVLGEPASGKSVILKNIGFKLAKEGKKVHFIELKEHSSDEIKKYFNEILKLNEPDTIFIVDDAHLKLSECERLVRGFKGKDGFLLIGSREIDELRREHPKEMSEFEHLSKTKVKAEDVTEEMIELFLKRKHNLSDDRIKTVSANLERYKHDLWFLSWALLAYNPEKDSVEEREIVEKVKESIRNIKKNGGVNGEEVFYPLSVFYRFEIPIERRFLENLGVSQRTIDDLLSLAEIIEFEEFGKRRMLLLHHSSIADVYFEAYKRYPDLGGKLREFDELSLFRKYLESRPMNLIDVVIRLGKDIINEKGGRTILKKLVEIEGFVDLIKGAIDKEDLRKIGWCLFGIARTNEEIALKLVDTVASKIDKEMNLKEIEKCLFVIALTSEKVVEKIVKRIDIQKLASKMDKEEDLEKIEQCLSEIARINGEVVKEIIEHLKPELREYFYNFI